MYEGSSSIIFGNLWLSLVIFSDLEKSLENVRKCWCGLQTNFGKSRRYSESSQKSSENRHKCCFVLWIQKKKEFPWPLGDMKLIFSCWKVFHSWNIFEHCKINFSSPHSHVIFSISLLGPLSNCCKFHHMCRCNKLLVPHFLFHFDWTKLVWKILKHR